MKKLILSLMWSVCLSLGAQTTLIPDMKFRRLDTQNGLSSSQVNCIYKDSRGYVWIGTPYGLNRYDGYRVKVFYSNKRDTTTMRDNYTDQIYESADGKLWMRQGMNYCVFDPIKESFERNAARELSKLGISCSVERLFIDSKKNIWIKDYEKAIYCYHPKTKKYTTIKVGYGEKEYMPSGISTLAEEGDKLIVATNTGELICLNGDTGEVEWTNKWMREHGSPQDQEYRLYIDKDQNYWCQVLGFTYIYIKKEDRWYTNVNEYCAAHGIEGLPGPLMVWNLVIDNNNWLWLVCDHDGLVVVDLNNKQWRQFLNNKHDETSISDNTLRVIYPANDGSMWIGTYKNGINQYVPGLSSLKSVELGDVTTVCEDKRGNYWVGTNDAGIYIYNPRTGEVLNHFTKDNSGLVSNIVVGSWAASDGTIWFGSYNGGLTHVFPSASDPAQATIVNTQATPGGLANNSVWALTEDKWGRLWFSTLGGGLQMLDTKTKKFTTWNTKNTNVPGDYLNSVAWNKKGWLMVGTGYFYSLVNPVSHKLINQVIPEDPNVPSNVGSTNYVIEDSRGLIWHGSNIGIIVYDQKTKFQKLIDMTDGLFGSGINSIIEDLKHNVWVVTDHGVSRITPQPQEDGSWQFSIRSYDSRDGLQKATYNQRSTWLTRDGKVLVGGQGGLDIINPSQLQHSRSKERPVFAGLQIFDQDVAVGKKFNGRVILDEALDECRELSLKFNDQFTIQLATNEVSVNNIKRFAYRLEGFNENWVKTSESNPNITYNSLRAGSYILHVRILKGDGTLGEEESTLEITIRPPLWRTRWMILLYMLAIAGIAWWWRRRFLKQQNEKMELEQLRREAEKKQWMSNMRKQMLQEQTEMTASTEKTDKEPVQRDVIENGEHVVIFEEKPQNDLQLSLQTSDIVAFIKAKCDSFKAPEGKNVRITFFPLVNEADVAFDKVQMERALDILLGNSVQFSPSECRIKIFVDKKDDKVQINISDNGIGVPDEAKPHMFDHLMDEDDGVNLYIVKDIITAHGGTITGDDNPGGGTLMSITLPSADVEVEEAVFMDDDE